MHRDRFLNHDAQTGYERGDTDDGVIVVKRRDEHGVDQTGGHHFGGRSETSDLRDTGKFRRI